MVNVGTFTPTFAQLFRELKHLAKPILAKAVHLWQAVLNPIYNIDMKLAHMNIYPIARVFCKRLLIKVDALFFGMFFA